MKVAFLTASVSRRAGGLLGSLQSLTRHLSVADITTDVLALEDTYSAADLDGWKPITPFLFSLAGPAAFGYATGMSDSLDTLKPDLLHTHGLWFYTSAATYRHSRKTGTPYLVTPHGMLDPWALAHSAWKKKIAALLFENKHLRSAACIHALCAAEADAIRNYGLVNPICQIPNGIDLPDPDTKYFPPPWSGTISNDKKILLYLGRIHPKKGIANLIAAWSRLHSKSNKEQTEWSLVVAGWDQAGHGEELRRQACDAGLGDAVHFIGPQFGAAKESCYHHADAFILPSFSEGLPMVVLEAWAYGLPVIMTPQCNIPEGIATGAALQVESNPDDITRGLQQFFELSDIERMTMGEKGLALVKDRFTWLKVAAEMKAVYEWVLGGGTPPACVRMD